MKKSLRLFRIARFSLGMLTPALFLLIPLLTSALWITSCFREDDLNFTRTIPLGDESANVHDFTLASDSGILAFKYLSGGILAAPDAQISSDWHWIDRNSLQSNLLAPKNYFDEEPKNHFWNSLGFLYDNGNGDGSGLIYNIGMWHHRVWFCPWWFITLLSALPLSIYAANRWRTRRPRNPSLCPTCSYDLRAHSPGTAGTNCPECGTPIAHLELKP